MATETSPQLDILEMLTKVTTLLAANDDGYLTQTKIRRTFKNDGLVDAAIAHGEKENLLERGDYNYIYLTKASKTRPYVVPEEAYYGVSESIVRKLWIESKYEPNEFFIENTARRDLKIVGPWTRPDLTLVSHKRFRIRSATSLTS